MHAETCLVALLLAGAASIAASAETPVTGHHRAPDAIAKALETPPTPAVAK